jgi:apolipoprotein N-acyltransferase
MAWVGLVPLLWALRDSRPREAFLLGWVAGLVHFTSLLYWIIQTMTNYGGLSWPLSLGVLLLLASYLALYVGLFGLVLKAASRGSRHLRWALAPPVWVAVELARAHALTGFPWANLGYSQYGFLPIIQVADLTGVYGVAFLIVLVNASLVELAENLAGRLALARKPTLGSLKVASVTGLALALSLGYGLFVLARPERTVPAETPSLRFALLQGNIPQDLKWDEAYQQETMNLYEVLVAEVSGSGEPPEFIVWPETATPFYLQQDGPLREQLVAMVRRSGTYHLIGSPAFERLDSAVAYYNRAYLVGPDGRLLDYYDKIHLVPFGEYVPLSSVLFFVRRLAYGVGDFYSGQRYTVFTIPKGRFGALICFEVIFPSLVRQFVLRGAQFLVNITNDAWFGRTAASAQHLSMAVFRAVENRVALIRAANTGITAAIDPFGRIVDSTGLFVRTYITGSIPVVRSPGSLYTRLGDLFAFGCVGAVVLAAGLGAGRPSWRRKTGDVLSEVPLEET